MRSHTRPWGQCLLCMSVFIPSLSSIHIEKTREPGRGAAIVSGFPKMEVELGAALHGRNLVHVPCGLPWCATSPPGSALDKTPMEFSCSISKTQLEGDLNLNSTPVLSSERGVCSLQHSNKCQHLMVACHFFMFDLSKISAIFSKYFPGRKKKKKDRFWDKIASFYSADS